MKNFQAVSPTTEDLKETLEKYEGQNAYLRKQLGESMKMKQKMIQCLTRSIQGERSEIEKARIKFSSEKETPRRSRREQRPTLLTLELKFHTSFLNGYKLLNVF